MKHSKIICLLVALFIFFGCRAQQLGERLSKTSVMIYNNSNEQLKFSLAIPQQRSWVYTIRPQEKSVPGPFQANSQLIFSIGTGDTQKRYLLRLNNTYMIFWDKGAKLWDLRRLVNNQQ
jgi:hypothetical protein